MCVGGRYEIYERCAAWGVLKRNCSKDTENEEEEDLLPPSLRRKIFLLALHRYFQLEGMLACPRASFEGIIHS